MKLKSLAFISLLVLIIFHLVGLVLFVTDPNASDLAWLNIVLCATLLFINASELNKEFYLLLLIFMGGYLLELVGVKTGYLFGEYAYDTALGFKMYEVPVIIGLNWYAIVLISTSLVRKLKSTMAVKAGIAAVFGVGMDFLIEPIAIKYDFWHWHSQEIPFYNYVCWFVALFAFNFVYLRIQKAENKLGIPLFIIWTVFFIILNFV